MSLHEMFRKVTSSPYHDDMLRSTQPLSDHFGINHFWYYRICNDGNFCALGTHLKWIEYCLEMSFEKHFPCLRHPDALEGGISLMKNSPDIGYKNVLQVAWNKFSINFSLNLLQKIPEGIEAFGFATSIAGLKADEKLLNELPLLRQFTKIFRQRQQKLFDLLYDNQFNIASHLGSIFYERPKTVALPQGREEFLRKIGFEWIFLLTPRERDILKLIAHGYPSSYIANDLRLSQRTVENYTATIKEKLGIRSKPALIQKANAYFSIQPLPERLTDLG